MRFYQNKKWALDDEIPGINKQKTSIIKVLLNVLEAKDIFEVAVKPPQPQGA